MPPHCPKKNYARKNHVERLSYASKPLRRSIGILLNIY